MTTRDAPKELLHEDRAGSVPQRGSEAHRSLIAMPSAQTCNRNREGATLHPDRCLNEDLRALTQPLPRPASLFPTRSTGSASARDGEPQRGSQQKLIRRADARTEAVRRLLSKSNRPPVECHVRRPRASAPHANGVCLHEPQSRGRRPQRPERCRGDDGPSHPT